MVRFLARYVLSNLVVHPVSKSGGQEDHDDIIMGSGIDGENYGGRLSLSLCGTRCS
jgi:hypothetical protein